MNKKVGIVVLIGVMFLGTSTLGGVNTPFLEDTKEEEGKKIALSLDFSLPLVEEIDDYVVIDSSSDMVCLMNEGFPLLPYKAEVITFPFGTKIESIEITTSDMNVLQLERKIKPAPKPMSMNMKRTHMKSEEGEIYASSEPYPSAWCTYTLGAGVKGDEHVVFLSLHAYPCRYVPVSNEVLYITDMEIKVSYELPERPLLQNDIYDLVIIAPSEFSEALQPLVQHKESHGVKTTLVTLNEIYGGTYFTSQGRDDAEKIKYFIKNAVEAWGIKYVLLIGGRHGGVIKEKWWCPVRYAHADDGTDETGFLSDLYFSDIYKYEDGNIMFDDWDSNGNGIYAEMWIGGKDTIDMYPDIYVGRLPCRNELEVDQMVDKIITYETTTYGHEWFDRMVVVGGDSYPHQNDPYYEGEEENKMAIEYMTDFEPIKLWTSTGTLTGPEDVIEEVNKGCGFLFFDGHGNPMGWSTHPPYDEETWIAGLGVRDMSHLSNENMYPVCLVGACHNSQFNVSIINLFKIWEGSQWLNYIYYGETAYECWSWRLTSKSGGGSIATLGYTGYDWFAIGDGDNDGIPDCTQYLSGFMHVNFFEEYGVNEIDTLGIVHANTLTKYINEQNPYGDGHDAKTVEEWALFGDPTLIIGGYAS